MIQSRLQFMIIFKRKISKKVLILAAVLLVAVLFFVFRKGEEAKTVMVIRGDVVQEVILTGTSKPRESVDLGFDTSGRVARSYVEVGGKVARGAVIAELDIGVELANLAKERASLAEEEATVGNTSEKLASVIREAYRAADNAIRNKTDQFFKTPRTNPTFEVKFSDGNFEHFFNVSNDVVYDLNSTRKQMETLLSDWQKELLLLNENNAKQYSAKTIERLDQVSDFLNKIAFAVNSFTPDNFAYESTVEGYKTAVNSARAEVSTAGKSVIDASSYPAGNAKINQIQYSINSLLASLAKSRIVAPFLGTITRQEAEVGETVQTGEALVSLMSLGNMYIEANVSEINIGKVTEGNKVKIEFDAFPGESMIGTVSYVEPGENMVDGVVNYKIRVELTGELNKKIKSGLTANLKLETARREAVLTIPQYAIFEKDGNLYTKVRVGDGEIKEVRVEAGLIGSDGTVEIVGGLNEGDKIEY